MIDKYEGCLADMKGYDLAMLAEELLAEAKRLREVNDELQGDLEQFVERVAEDEAGLKDELEATEAEVKRLREGIKQLTVRVEGMSTGYKKPIVKALKEMIE